MKRTRLGLSQAAKYLGCPKNFLKGEVERGRLQFVGLWPFHALTRQDLDLYRQECAQSTVWAEFAAAGYVPDDSI